MEKRIKQYSLTKLNGYLDMTDAEHTRGENKVIQEKGNHGDDVIVKSTRRGKLLI